MASKKGSGPLRVLYVYCSPEEKKRIAAAARKARQTQTGYAMTAIMQRLEADEKSPEPKKRDE